MRLRFWYWPKEDSTVRRMAAMSLPLPRRSATEPYPSLNWLTTGSGAPSTTRRISSTPSRTSSAITHLPSGSMPRRPARPAIWVSSLWVRLRKPRSVRLVSDCSTTLFAGMWIPRDMVSVAKTTRHRPRSKRCSTSRFTLGRMPAWCMPTPMPSAWKMVWFSGDSAMVGVSATASRMASSTCWRWARLSSGLPSASTVSMARSQPARLKMK